MLEKVKMINEKYYFFVKMTFSTLFYPLFGGETMELIIFIVVTYCFNIVTLIRQLISILLKYNK